MTEITKDAWDASRQTWGEFAEEGSPVEEAIVEYFACVAPPHMATEDIIQCGEVVEYIAGRPFYTTFLRGADGWRYYLSGCLRHREVAA
jgi:hypothetical protein